MYLSRLLAAAMLCGCVQAFAAPAAIVEGLQMPAWVERAGRRQPLQIGATLTSGDRILTGADARVLLRLEEGSHVKLGADAQLDLPVLSPPAEPTGVFRGVLSVVKGAFRFTTAALGRARTRDIEAHVSTITIGIRGTDVWGKAEPSRDFVVLLEGKIDIRREGEAAQRMETPLSLFMAPKGAATQPVRPVNPDDLRRWAQETELQDGAGVVTGEGQWALHLASFRQPAAARRLQQSLRESGYAAQTESVRVGDRVWTRVSLQGFASRVDAGAVRARLHSVTPSAWIEEKR